MNKIVVIHQPDFLSYLGFFDRLLHCNLFIVLDHVQYSKCGWHNRDKIKTPQGEKWLTIAVDKFPLGTKINEVILSTSQNWRENNMNLIKNSYKNSDFFDEIFPFIEKLYDYKPEKLYEFNMKSIQILMELFDINLDIVLSSSLDPQNKSNDMLVDILTKVNATTYLSGIGARNYYNPVPFEKANINVIWQDFQHPVYKQINGEFIKYLSSVDLLFNCGIQQSRQILRGENL